MSTLDNWNEWKRTLGKAVDIGEAIGMSEKTINNIAEKVGTFLSNAVEPRNHQERVLKEMWDVADENDRKTLAKLVVKMTDK